MLSDVIPCHPMSVSRFNLFYVILTDLMTDVSSHRICLLQDGRGLFRGILCCTSGFKGNLMHQSLFSGLAWHIGYSKV